MGLRSVSIIFFIVTGAISIAQGRSLKNVFERINELNRPTEYFCKTDEAAPNSKSKKLITCDTPNFVKSACTEITEESPSDNGDTPRTNKLGSNIIEMNCSLCGKYIKFYGKVSNDNFGDPGQTTFERNEYNVKQMRDLHTEYDLNSMLKTCHDFVKGTDEYGDFFQEKNTMRDVDLIDTIRDWDKFFSLQKVNDPDGEDGLSVFDGDMNPLIIGLGPSGDKCDPKETEVADYMQSLIDSRKNSDVATPAIVKLPELSYPNPKHLPFEHKLWPSRMIHDWGYVLADNKDHKKLVEDSMNARLALNPPYLINIDEMNSRSHHLVFDGALPTPANLEKVLQDRLNMGNKERLGYGYTIVTPRCEIKQPVAEFLNVSSKLPSGKLVTKRYKMTCHFNENVSKKTLSIVEIPMNK